MYFIVMRMTLLIGKELCCLFGNSPLVLPPILHSSIRTRSIHRSRKQYTSLLVGSLILSRLGKHNDVFTCIPIFCYYNYRPTGKHTYTKHRIHVQYCTCTYPHTRIQRRMHTCSNRLASSCGPFTKAWDKATKLRSDFDTVLRRSMSSICKQGLRDFLTVRPIRRVSAISISTYMYALQAITSTEYLRVLVLKMQNLANTTE